MKRKLKMVLYIILGILVVAALGIVIFMNTAPQLGAVPAGERLKRLEASPNYKDGVFQNLVPTPLDIPVSLMASSAYKMLVGFPEAEPATPIKTVPLDHSKFTGPGSATEVAVSWFGHSSVLIRMEGKTILTDPVFGERASTFSFAGPKRFAYDHHVTVDDLPPLDAVILSHDHYDHLDYPTILQLKGKVKRFFVPLGVGAHLEKWGIDPAYITELDWWQSVKFGEIELVCAPSRHFSGRSFKRNGTLWSSWVLLGRERRVYFGADSGYYPGFKTIGEKYGPFDLALLECGAYNEAWANIHMMPEETAQAQIDVKAKKLIPIHWAKFNLAPHPWREPIRRITKKSAELGTTLITPRIGEVTVLDVYMPQSQWWESY